MDGTSADVGLGGGISSSSSSPLPAAEGTSMVTTIAPVTNAALSQAVLAAIQQCDTTRAFDLMLLNEQMAARESEHACLKEELAFVKAQLATQTQDESAMYQYLHAKLDHSVATIAELEQTLSSVRQQLDLEQQDRLDERERLTLQWETERTRLEKENARLSDELQQLHAFAQQKRRYEERVEALEAEMEANRAQFQEDLRENERRALFEKDRMKKEMLQRMKETKEELLRRTDDQLHTTTKRTMMENDQVVEELAFQSHETERVLYKYRSMEDEVRRLTVQNKVLEENERVLAKKNHYYQKILQQLQSEGKTTTHVTMGKPWHEMTDQDGSEAAPAGAGETTKIAAFDEAGRALRDRVVALESALEQAQFGLQRFQQERHFMIAQQDEIIQFLCRTVHEATEHVRTLPHKDDENEVLDDGLISGYAKMTTTMHELVTTVLPTLSPRLSLLDVPHLDELTMDETRFVWKFLLEKMKQYQQHVAVLYKGKGSSVLGGHTTRQRELLAKQLGVELPPIAPTMAHGHVATNATSPLKIKRRVQQSNSNSPTTTTTPTNVLSMVATSFNFLPPTSPTFKQSPHKRLQPQDGSTSGTMSPAKTKKAPNQVQQTVVPPTLPFSGWSQDENEDVMTTSPRPGRSIPVKAKPTH